MKILVSGLVLLGMGGWFSAAEGASQEGYNPDSKFLPLSPEKSIETIRIPKGYRLERVASEPMVEEPTAFAFDGNGAMYVCEWRTYMQDEEATGQLKPVSRVVKLVDTDGDGVMDKRTVFVDNVILPRMVLPLHDRVLLSFTGDTSVWAYFDDNGDGVADRREVAFKGHQTGSDIEHQASGLIWNLDNTICTNDFRFTYRKGKLTDLGYEHGTISQWGLARDDDGRLYGSSAGAGNPIHGFQLPAGYPIVRIDEQVPGYRVPYSICKVWDQSGGGYQFDKQRVLKEFSASCGQTIFRSDLMPEFYGTHIVAEPVGRLIRMSRIDWNQGHGVARNAYPDSEFIRSTDAYFRPVWTETAPDGSLTFSDMYRGIIQEKTWFPTNPDNPRQDWVARYHRVKKWGMIDVVRHGRIYRLVPEDRKPGPQPRMLDETPEQLVAHLAHPNAWWRDTAQMLIVTRGDLSAVPALKRMAATHADPNARIQSMWALRGLGALPDDLVMRALGDPNARVRRAAVQLAEPSFVKGEPVVRKAFASLPSDPDAQVRTQYFLACRRAGTAAPAGLTDPKANPIVHALIQKEQAEAQAAVLGESGKRGMAIYESLCTGCHGPDGKGLKQGDSLVAPALERSEWFRDGGRVDVLARIVLKGQTGPIKGVTYGEGFMLPLEHAYDDGQLADVLNFIGQRWNGWKEPVAADAIARVRKEVAERTKPWNHEELEAIKAARKK